ncbi:endolytic transglycosylase MltG [Gluconacetobacter diazotrophicus]|uniref:Endolytic murein transglycosylase n=1 Tax=Gluconacetobacter diazotrophicus (strain ATCC 49037 / DSM 5601 / CCUG 37298 / CIP 103539 / LMG 7603 / PAl5) TaxID=272568 RepID=A9HRD6_GLUDA|nr:endolytic transglycosylase MltG [Gluconacetobacter diazotrophicus]CAP56883.1 putative aminodeoxychorismate lyase [Gluconacetobacter diazotrophicus PA1 5]
MFKRLIITGLLLLALLCMGAGGVAGWAWWLYGAQGPATQARAVVVPRGGLGSTVATLQHARVIRDGRLAALVFRVAVHLTRRDGVLHAAELEFPAYGSIRDALFVLRHARPVLHPITVPEGLSVIQVIDLVDRAPVLSGPMPSLAEGDVLPQTYDYEWGTSRAALLARMRGAMDTTLDAVWRDRTPVPEIPDRRTLLILASMVERETAIPAERKQVARVFINRLRLGMRLQSDPTVVYGINHGAGPLGHALTRAELAAPSAYNTYTLPGLPVGPICSPGRAALDAVAHPADGDALYFVADGTGGHVFAGSLADHNRNVGAYRARKEPQGALTGATGAGR